MKSCGPCHRTGRAPGPTEHARPLETRLGALGDQRAVLLEYTQVEPAVVVELDVDTSFERYRWRHAARFLRVRNDLAVTDLHPGTCVD